jgi:geranylgeranyl diphosphate synthase, type II
VATTLKDYIRSRGRLVDQALNRHLLPASAKPPTIHKAMRYSMFAGGKRLRPILCLAAAEACGGSESAAMPLACAVECIHTYSLIHDDLPCMDNDDFRRGKPTSHKVFGEGVAVLAGDALLTIAFELACRSKGWSRYSHSDLVKEIAVTSGSLYLIAGQVADIENEGKKISHQQLRYVHERKTSALLTTSIRLGAMSANARTAELRALTRFGYNLGMAFQVIDDILDATKTTEELGKTAGKDAKAGKATYPSILGMKRSEQEAARYTKAAIAALKPFGKKANRLHQLAGYLLNRQN